MKKDLKISVVVPVYNTEKFLRECVESILKWNNKKANELDFPGEILLIDNNSTDGSLSLAKDIARDYKKVSIRVLKCEVGGASAVRNFGLKEALGEYIWFIDSDDYVREGAVAEILERISTNDVDAVVLSAQKVLEDGKEIAEGLLGAVSPETDKNWQRRFVRYGLAPWQVVVRRTWLISNALFYDEGMIHEDMAIISSYILYTDKMASIEKPIYYYRQRKGSVLHGEVWNEHELDIFKALELLSSRFEKMGKFNKYKAELEYFYIWNLLDDAAREFHKFPEGRQQFAQIRQALSSRFPKWRKNKYFRECPLMVRVNCRLAYRGIVR